MHRAFPGMDPYLDDPAFWPDFHATFINYLREAVAEKLPENYEARIGERITLVHYPPAVAKRIGPDVSVTKKEGPESVSIPIPGIATLEPVTLPNLIGEEVGETYIEIRRRPDRTLVTVVELLSPSNKEDPDRGAYLEKREALLRQNIHLFEIDLLLGGQRLPFARPLPPGDYYGFVSRADRRPDCDVYAWSVREPLPVLPVPLRTPDPDALVDLGSVMATAFERGRYSRSLDDGSPIKAETVAETRHWIEERAKPRRP